MSEEVASSVDELRPTKRPRVLVLEGTDRVGGGQRVTLDMVSSLGSDFEFDVVVPGLGKLQQELRSIGIEPHTANYPAPPGKFGVMDRIAYLPRGLGSIRKLVLLIRRTEPELLYATSRTALWAVLAGRITGTPVVVHLHMVPPTAKTAWFLRRVCAMKQVRAVMVVSQVIVDRISLPASKVRIVPNGIDADAFRPRPELRGGIRSEFAVGSTTHVAAIVGELSPGKGQFEAISALSGLVSDGHDAVLVLVGAARPGNEQYEARLRESVTRHGLADRVIFTGQRDDVGRLLNGFDLLIVPSRGPSGEACPMVVLEAWATGVPVLASNTRGLPEMLGGNRGTLFDISDPNGLTRRWRALITDPKCGRATSGSGLLAASERHSMTAVAGRMRDVLTEAMADRSGRSA